MAILQLQRDHGVEPASVAALDPLQMPIWVSLYRDAGQCGGALPGAGCGGFRYDRVGPVLCAAASDRRADVLQTKQSAKTTPVDPQMKMVTTMMPIMFTVFSIFCRRA